MDPANRAADDHAATGRPKTFADMEEAAKAMREQDGRRESLFRQSVEAEKTNAPLLEQKFPEPVKRDAHGSSLPAGVRGPLLAAPGCSGQKGQNVGPMAHGGGRG